MKVLIITETLLDGGSELFALRLTRALRQYGIDASLLSLNKRYENTVMTDSFRDIPIQRLSLPFYPLLHLADKLLLKLKIDFSIRYFLQSKQLGRILGNYEVVHSHYIQADYLLARLKSRFSFKLVVTQHGDYTSQYSYFKKGQLRFWLHLDKKLNYLSALVDQWVVIAAEQFRFLQEVMQVPADRIQQIYNGFPVPADLIARKDNAHPFTIGMLARGIPEKGWEDLIEVFRQLPGNNCLLLVGWSDYLAGLKQKYGADSRIHFTGFSTQPVGWLSKMDCFVLPTVYAGESLPNAIVEALYCGLPVIASDIGEIAAMITDPQTGQKAGLLLQVKNGKIDRNELYEHLLYLLYHPSQLHQMAQTATAAFERFTMERCVTQYRELYRRIIDKN